MRYSKGRNSLQAYNLSGLLQTQGKTTAEVNFCGFGSFSITLQHLNRHSADVIKMCYMKHPQLYGQRQLSVVRGQLPHITKESNCSISFLGQRPSLVVYSVNLLHQMDSFKTVEESSSKAH